MSRSLCLLAAAAVGCGLGAEARAQNVSLTGLLDVSAGSFQTAGTPRVWRTESGQMSSSFLSFKGTEDTGGGLKVKFALEHYLRADTGTVGRVNGDAFWSRNAYVGLSGQFGTSTLGRNTTPLFVSTLLFNAFGDSFGFSPSIRQVFVPSLLPFYGDSAWNNSLAYSSNEEDGLTINVIGSVAENTSQPTGKNFGASLLYFNGPLAAAAAWQLVKNPGAATPAGWTNQRSWQLGVSYELPIAKVYGQYTQVRSRAYTGSRTHIYGFGAAVPLGPGRVLAQYGMAYAKVNGSEADNKTLSLGYDYALSKLTDVYGVYMRDTQTGLSSGQSLAGGLRVRF